MGKHLLYDEIVNVVQTYSQAHKTEHTSLPDRFKEIKSRDTDTESEEEVYDEEDDQSWEDQASEDQITPMQMQNSQKKTTITSAGSVVGRIELFL